MSESDLDSQRDRFTALMKKWQALCEEHQRLVAESQVLLGWSVRLHYFPTTAHDWLEGMIR